MFRLIRLVIFTLFAFLAGVFYERLNAKEACVAAGGEPGNGLCILQSAAQ